MDDLVEKIINGNIRSAAKAITILENNQQDSFQLLKKLYPYTGKALIIGITGAPGAGKSSLVDQLIRHLRQIDKKVGVLAVDPSSPYTGGAILGDRVRMQAHATDPKVFIRSLGTHGNLGGISRAAKDAVYVLDALGLDVIIVETVGVGQAEFEIMKIVDTTILVLTPNMGDSIQITKAGIMEVADIFVVNKADLKGADNLISELERVLALNNVKRNLAIVRTIATENYGITELWEKVCEQQKRLKLSGEYLTKKIARLQAEVLDLAKLKLEKKIKEELTNNQAIDWEMLATKKNLSPYEIVEKWW